MKHIIWWAGLGISLGLSFECGAQCSSPTAASGARNYFTADNKMKLCAGSTWVDFKTNGTAGACATSGQITYVSGTYRYCAGSTWQIIGTAACTVSSLTYQNKLTNAIFADVSQFEFSEDKNRLYVVSLYRNRVDVLNTSSPPAAPTLAGSSAAVTGMGDLNGLRRSGNHLFVTSVDMDRLVIFSIASPDTPAYVSEIGNGVYMQNPWKVDLSADGNYAFVPSFSSGPSNNKCYINVFNVSNRAAPTLVSTYDVSAAASVQQWCNAFRISGNVAYIAVADVVVSLNISNPAAITVLDTTTQSASNVTTEFAISPDGKTLYGAGQTNSRFNVFNVTNPSALSHVGNLLNTTNFNTVEGVAYAGNYVIASSMANDRLTAVNVSNPASPSVAASVTTATHLDRVDPVAVKGRYIYAGARAGNIAVYDMGCDPTGKLGSCSTAGAIDYFPDSGSLGYCDGTSWQVIAQP